METVVRTISRYVIVAAVLLAAAFYYLAQTAAAQQGQGVVTPDNPETRPPALSVVQNNAALSVVASDDNLDSATWQAAGPFAQEPSCDSDGLVYGPAGPEARFLTLTPADNGKWYCFKVADTDDNYGYAKFEVLGVTVEEEAEETPEPEEETDGSPLLLNVVQSAGSLTAFVNRSDYEGGIQVLIVAAGEACGGEAFDRSARSVFSGRHVSGLSWRDNGKHYCFRAVDGDGYVYSGIEVGGLPAPAGAETSAPDSPASADEDEAPAGGEPQTAGPAETERETAAGDDDEKEEESGNDTLRLVGITVAATGIIAIIAVILLSRRQAGSDTGENDDDF